MIDIYDADIIEIEQQLGITFDETRKNIIKIFDDVQACPGSGKTTMVAAKLLIIAKKWQSKHQGICVLTHTNVAKQEIIARLNKDSDGVKLLSYPHFIGTIQEFINKYIAIPALRSNELCVNQIDDEMCNTKAWYLLSRRTRTYLENKFITSLQELQYKFSEGRLKLKVPGFNSESTSNSYKEIKKAKDILINDGYYYYHEMYAFAEKFIHETPKILDSIRHRFPIAFIDEMQDTQKFQDELLNKIFLHDNVQYQRFGDPDQAIYSGSGEENQTYNPAILNKVENSHRFDNSIALLAKNLSYNRIALTSNKTVPEASPHTIFLVDENSRYNVFNAFARLCEQVIPVDSVKPIKTVGAVGKRKEDSLTICHYLDSFDKNNNTNKFKPKKLIHYFYEAKRLRNGHEAYQMILNGIARCGRISDCELIFSDNSKYFYSIASTRKYLKDSNNLLTFNILVKEFLDSSMDVNQWNNTISKLLMLSGIQTSIVPQDFILFDNSTVQNTPLNETCSNRVIIEINGRRVENEVSTIHSVKGETHAATLVLETKNYNFDIGTLIDYILNENTIQPKAVRKKGFMKMLYVAFSRPEHLLCIAMDKSRFPTEHLHKCSYAGWRICDLTT